jgi:ABC-type iron transport system FetAB ATPase subunit
VRLTEEQLALLNSISWVLKRVDDRHRLIGISGTTKEVMLVQVSPEAAVFGKGDQWVVSFEGQTLSQLPKDAAKSMPCFEALGDAKLHAMLELAKLP